MSQTLTPAMFVTIWQASASIEAVSEATGLRPEIVSQRASTYRKKGVRLKYMTRHDPKKLDVDQLNSIVDASENKKIPPT